MYTNYLFIISGDAKVTFKNIKFINAYKTTSDYNLIDDYELEGIYGAALDIKNANVTLDNCSFIYNMVNYDASTYEFTYGGAISNFGNLTVLNSYFYGNAIGSMMDIYGYGGSIFNKGNLFLDNSTFIDSRGSVYSFGGAIYNDGFMIINNSVIRDSYCWEESKGSAIYNNGELILLNSIIENNTIERTDYNYIYGNIFNSGKLMAVGNIFRNNTANYKQPNSQYYGTPTIYNIGELNLSYNVFSDNVHFNGISKDVYLTGGASININDNWWSTNENPYDNDLINLNIVQSWIMLDLTPAYCSINLNESVDIIASWKLSTGEKIKKDLPISDIVFSAIVNGIETRQSKIFSNQKAKFLFNDTKNRGTYEIKAEVNSFFATSIVDVGKIPTFITIRVSDNEVYFNETILLEVFLKDEFRDNLTAEVILFLNNKQHFLKIDEGYGSISLSDLTPNHYTVKAVYNGNTSHSKSDNQTNITVKKIPVKLDILPVNDFKTNESVNMTINLNAYKAEGMAYLYVNGEYKQPIYLSNGNTTFNLNYFSKGSYNLTIMFPENSYYESATDSIFFNVDISQVSFNITSRDIYVGERAIITIEVSSQYFNDYAILSINGVNNTVHLKNKKNDITLNSLPNGTYEVMIIFNGNDRFVKANASSSFNVSKRPVNLDVTVERNNMTGKITVKTDSEKCSGQVSLFVNQKRYHENLNNGLATFEVEFDKGTNYIYVFYSGDSHYDSTSWNTTIGNAENFFLIAPDMTGFEHNDFNYTVSLYEENGMAVPNQRITVKLGDKTYYTTTNNRGVASLLLNLNKGNYLISASYNNVQITSHIEIKPITFNITVNASNYGENNHIIVEFEDNISGKVCLEFIGGQKIITDILNSKARYDLSKLNAGDYSISIHYLNNYFNSSKINKRFTINKANMDLAIHYNNLEINKAGAIIVNLLDNAEGTIKFIIDGITYQKEVKDSKAVLNISGLAGGYHILKINYSGDRNYNGISLERKFPVKHIPTTINLIINKTSHYGEELTVIAKVNEDATGNISFVVGNLTEICEIKKGLATWKVNGLDVGEYVLTAKYSSDSLYLNQNNETTFKILKSNSAISLYVNEVYLNENIRIYAKLSPNATGTVTFSMLGYYSPRNKTVTSSSCSWYILPLKSGNYTIIAQYNGDKNYNPSNTTFILNVNQYKSVLDVEINDVSNNERVIANIKLMADGGIAITGNIILTIGNKDYNVSIKNGRGSLMLGKMNEGIHNYVAVYEGSNNFSKCRDEGSFKVFDSRIGTYFNVNNVTAYIGGNEKLTATLFSENGKAICDGAITVCINNKKYDLITDSEGKISLDIDMTMGITYASIIFNGTERYYPTSANVSISVLSTIQSMDIVKLYGSGTQYFAIFKDSTGKALGNTPVTFKIGSKTYTFNTAPNGIAKLNINMLPGVYTIQAFNPKTGEIVENSIRIFAYVMNNKDVVKYYGENKKYTVRIYDENGSAVGEGEIVTFKVNGKTYKVKTDKNGYATCNINLKPKTYTITATFNNYTVSNKITVKPLLTFKKISYKKSIFKYSVKLINSKGKIVKNKKVKFKFLGKTYKIKTSKKGISTLNIAKRMVPYITRAKSAITPGAL